GKTVGESNTLARPELSPGQAPEAAPAPGSAATGAQPQGDEAAQPPAQPQPRPAPQGQQQHTAEAQKAAPGVTAPDLEKLIAAVNWKTDVSGGIQRVAMVRGLAPYGNGKARALVWNY